MNSNHLLPGVMAVVVVMLLALILFLFIENQQRDARIHALLDELTSLRTDYAALQIAQGSLHQSYTLLQGEHAALNENHTALASDYTRLESEYRTLQESYANITSFRLPKDIPSSPPIEGASYLLTPGALLLDFPQLGLVSGANTTSMHPTISIGHLAVVTKQFDPSNLPVGAIIAYNSSSSPVLIAHRIIGIKDQNGLCYAVQGDSNPFPDPECVRPSQIIYRIIGVFFTSATSPGYAVCPSDYAAVSLDGALACIPKTIRAGVYTADQPLDQGSRYIFCSESKPDKPYTVIAPDGKVYCDNR